MNFPTLKSTVGAFRVLRRRVQAVGQSGLTVWTDAGERAATEAGRGVVALAHANECAERTLADEVNAIVKDGVVTSQEVRRLRGLASTAQRCAERDHDIGEIATT